MPLIQSFKTGDYITKLYKYNNLGYGYKIYTKIGDKQTCVGQSCVYFKYKDKCIEEMHNELNMILGITKTLF